MPEGVVAQARTLEHAERTVSLDYPTLKGKSGDLYLTDRLATLRTLKLAKDVTKTVTKSKHLGRSARRRARPAPTYESAERSRARYNDYARRGYAYYY